MSTRGVGRGVGTPGMGVLVVLALVVALLVGGLAGVLVAVAFAGLMTFALRGRGRSTPTASVVPVVPSSPLLTPVADLSTGALGREWLRTAGALGAELEPGTRQHLVRRRQDTLDELERRDPAGFARWLADGARVDSDPASWVRGDAPQP